MTKKINKNDLIVILILLIYIPYIYFIFRRIGIDSDYSNLVLEAKDIISGNLFLKGWNLTGLTFLTTDLIYFISSVLFFGVSTKAYVFAISLMFLGIILSSILLVKGSNRKISWKKIIFLLLLIGFPTITATMSYRAHTGAIIWSFLSLYFINNFLNSSTKSKKKLLIPLFMILGVVGDPIIILVLIIPVIIYSIYKLLFLIFKLHAVDEMRNHYYLIFISTFSIFVGTIIDKLYFLIGKANKNSFLSLKKFELLEAFPKKLNLYIQSISQITNSNFFGDSLFSIHTIKYMINIFILFLGFYFIYINIKKAITNTENDYITTILGIGFILMSITYILTDISVDINSSRYIVYFTALLGIVIVRNIDGYNIRQLVNDKKINILYFLVAIVLFILSFQRIDVSNDNLERYNPLSETLIANNLKNGYASFWNSSILTVKTKNKSKVRAIIIPSEKTVEGSKWFSKETWYNEPTNFIIIDENESIPQFGISKISVVKIFGEPSREITIENYHIYIYDYDISKILLKKLN